LEQASEFLKCSEAATIPDTNCNTVRKADFTLSWPVAPIFARIDANGLEEIISQPHFCNGDNEKEDYEENEPRISSICRLINSNFAPASLFLYESDGISFFVSSKPERGRMVMSRAAIMPCRHVMAGHLLRRSKSLSGTTPLSGGARFL